MWTKNSSGFALLLVFSFWKLLVLISIFFDTIKIIWILIECSLVSAYDKVWSYSEIRLSCRVYNAIFPRRRSFKRNQIEVHKVSLRARENRNKQILSMIFESILKGNTSIHYKVERGGGDTGRQSYVVMSRGSIKLSNSRQARHPPTIEILKEEYTRKLFR
jgi:hypothetical protein